MIYADEVILSHTKECESKTAHPATYICLISDEEEAVVP